jgi:hypothetical protein
MKRRAWKSKLILCVFVDAIGPLAKTSRTFPGPANSRQVGGMKP